jgi:hypothetical protein
MAAERIADMTLDELKVLVNKPVDERIQQLYRPKDPRSLEEILDSIDQHMWTPPPGAPSTLELLREDRDR